VEACGVGSGRPGAGEGFADLVGLVAVRDSDGDVLRAERLSARVSFACADSAASEDPCRKSSRRIGRLGVGADGVV
jgi:hypothetical protein